MKIAGFVECVYLGSIFATFVGAISVEKDLSLTLSEKKTVDKFRSRVAPLLTKWYMKSDLYLARWLRARDFDITAAEALFHQHLKWRQEWNMDSILQEDWSDMKRSYPATTDSYDKEGRPVGIMDIYEWDIRAVALQGQSHRYSRYINYLMENLTMQVYERQAQGMNVTQWIVLGSANGFNVIQHACPACIASWIHFAQTVENNYIGWTHELIIVDATPTIGTVMEILRPLLSPMSRDAFRVFNANQAKWIAYLDERIEKDQRPPQYGGTRS